MSRTGTFHDVIFFILQNLNGGNHVIQKINVVILMGMLFSILKKLMRQWNNAISKGNDLRQWSACRNSERTLFLRKWRYLRLRSSYQNSDTLFENWIKSFAILKYLRGNVKITSLINCEFIESDLHLLQCFGKQYRDSSISVMIM